jgi:neutral ceramidase
VGRAALARLTVAAAAALAAAAPAASAAAPSLRAGTGLADITPPVGTPMFAYTERSKVANPTHLQEALQVVADPDTNLYAKSFVPSEGIHTRVRASAIVLERGGEKFAIAQADLGGLPYALVQEVLARIRSTGITGERLLLSATHTHASTGPIWPADNLGYAALGGDAFDPRIFALTAEGIAAAILEADGRLQPARLGVATAEVPDATRNRAFDPFERNADLPAGDAARRAASIDPELTVVRVDDAGGRPMGVWSNFAIHPTSFGGDNLLFSGDNAGVAERVAASAIADAARASGRPVAAGRPFVNVWTNGNEGDIAPNGDPDRAGGEPAQYAAGGFGGAHLAGTRVAAGIVRAWRAAGRRLDGDPDLDARRTFLAFDGTPADGRPVGPTQALGAGVVADAMCAPVDDLAGPGQGRKLPVVAGVALAPSIVPVSVWRIADQGVVALPSEVTRQMGARIRRAVGTAAGGRLQRVAMAGLTNGYVSYTATPEEYDACAYEGSFTLFGRHQGARYRDVASGLAEALAEGRPAPSGAPEPPPTGIASDAGPPPRRTPSAGEVVEQPATTARRHERVTFRWAGGDPALDAPRGATFVEVQRRTSGGAWATVTTDDGLLDTTARGDGDVWTETLQLTECHPVGGQRFVVHGRADRGAGPEPYTVVSQPFTVQAAQLTAGAVRRAGDTARVRITYPDPGEGALLALPRLLREGSVTLRAGGRSVRAAYDAATGEWVAPVPAGPEPVTVAAARDRCGNALALSGAGG